LSEQQMASLTPRPRLNSRCIAAVKRPLGRYLAGLPGAVTSCARVATQLSTDGGFVPVKQSGYLRLVVSGFHEGVNLISFSLAEVFVGHKQL
jgi:hypothetical protein